MSQAQTRPGKSRREVEAVTIRFAGDSGDGMQFAGSQFTTTTAIVGNDLSTLPDFPAEIRAPAGTLPGVSSFQIHFSSRDIRTPGDEPDVLIALNPAALKVNLFDLPEGATIIVDENAFNEANLKKAGYKTNPLEDASLSRWRVVPLPITFATLEALRSLGLGAEDQRRARNMFALGIVYWLYERPIDATVQFIESKFRKSAPLVADANLKALKAGYFFGDTTDLFPVQFRVGRAAIAPGLYRKITGNEATALGFLTASRLAGRPLFYGSYPITPASDILHELSRFKNFGVVTFQAEDEIAAIGAAIGAAFGGALALTGTSGPGVALKSEAINLAVMTELPVVIADVQRGGPSTGLPTKTEQADLLQCLFGRNGESPVAIVAPATPADCFYQAIEAFRIALKYMTPVFFLSDGYLANGAEPWRIPRLEDLKPIETRVITGPNADGKGFLPYLRDPETLARSWALPGTAGLEHRIGGLEKADLTGNVSYDPANHEKMVRLRAERIARIANDIPEAEIFGDPEGDLLVVGWGSTYGAITSAVEEARADGLKVSSMHLRHLNPFPRNVGETLRRFRKVLVPELNLGQLLLLLRGRFLVDAQGLNKVQGQPFKVGEILEKIKAMAPKRAAVGKN